MCGASYARIFTAAVVVFVNRQHNFPAGNLYRSLAVELHAESPPSLRACKSAAYDHNGQMHATSNCFPVCPGQIGCGRECLQNSNSSE